MLRQIEWGKQNAFITKTGVLSVTAFLKKLCFDLRTSYKELIFCTHYTNVHIYTF